MPDLEANFHWYLENQDEIVKMYNGKVIAIKDKKIIGAFKTKEEGYWKIQENHKLGTFILQKCSPGEKDYTLYDRRGLFRL